MCYDKIIFLTINHLVLYINSGDHVIAMDDMYGGTNRYFRKVASKSGIEISFVDATDPAKIEKAMKPNTKMVGLDL